MAGFLVAAALVGAGTVKGPQNPGPLAAWTGEGARPGLYYYDGWGTRQPKDYVYYECRAVGKGTFTVPAPTP